MINEIVVASHNQGKIDEYRKIFDSINIKILSIKDLGINIDVEEVGNTFEENAYIKARHIYNKVNLPTIADDSGLMIDYLNGQPGVKSARFAGENASDADRVNKVLSLMKNAKNGERSAKFISSVVFIASFWVPDSEIIIKASGQCLGEVAFEPKGSNGFGYDPIFLVDKKTFAEMTELDKNNISHRGKAVDDFRKKLEKFICYEKERKNWIASKEQD